MPNSAILRCLGIVGLLALGLSLTPREGAVPSDLLLAQEAVQSSSDWCFGRAELNRLQGLLQSGRLSPNERSTTLAELAEVQLRLGLNQQALASIEQAIRQAPPGKLSKLKRQRATVWLRLAEVRNCLEQHSEMACLFPLEGTGVHSVTKPAENALQDLLAVLESGEAEPRDRWLINIVAMQLGRYPEAVPAEARLEGEILRPDPERRFHNRAVSLGMTRRDLCGGVVVEDMDGDGLLDILSSSSGFEFPVQYWSNLGNGRFQDRTEPAGLSGQVAAFNVRVGDYDNDGDQDILLLRGAYLEEMGRIRNSLLRNNGDGTFTDVTHQAGLAEPAHPTGTAVWGDFDGDGYLDIFIGNETTPRGREAGHLHPCQLFHNNGDGTFTDIAAEAGVDALLYAKGVAAGDIDNDGDLDLLVTNFSHWRLPWEERGRDLLFRNRGDGHFDEVGHAMGFQGAGGRAFGCWFFDYDNDGWLDIYLARYEAGSLEREVSQYLQGERTPGFTRVFRNDRGERFVDVSRQLGLNGTYSTMGCSFGDLDNDGFLDLYLGTGSVFYHYLVPNVTLKNVKGRRFEDATLRYGLAHLQKGHGISFADLDQDGDQDIYAQMGGNFQGDPYQNALFENPGTDNRFVHLQLVSNQPVGARVEVETEGPDGAQSFHRAVGSVSSFGYTPLRQEIGLGRAERITQILVRWPSGREQAFTNCPQNTLLEIREGRDEVRDLGLKAFRFPRSSVTPDDSWCLPATLSFQDGDE